MSYRDMPYVVRTLPPNGVADIPTSQVVKVEFNMDIDINTLGSIFVNKLQTGEQIPVRVDYKDRVATISSMSTWEPNTLYRVTIAGDDILEPEQGFVGIKSILGYPMAGSFTITFRTVLNATLPAPDVIAPNDQSLVQGEIVTLTWSNVPGAVRYMVELSQFSGLDPYTWKQEVTGEEVTPDVVLPEKTHYWRVQPIAEDGTLGEWSKVFTFGVDVSPNDPIVPDDGVPNDGNDVLVFPEEIVVFPEEDWVNVNQKLRTITAVIPAGIDVTDEALRSAIRITKQDAFDSMSPALEVASNLFKVTRQLQEDGSTMIIITLEGVI